jgi:hypothetical protein
LRRRAASPDIGAGITGAPGRRQVDVGRLTANLLRVRPELKIAIIAVDRLRRLPAGPFWVIECG